MAELWQRGRVTLTWSPAHELHGLEIVMRRRSLGEINAAMLDEPDDRRDWADLTTKQRIAQREANAADIAALVVSWNLADDDGVPVPPSAGGVLSVCDGPMLSAMWEAYNEATLRMSPPLPPSSDAGHAVPPPGEWDLPAQEVLTVGD